MNTARSEERIDMLNELAKEIHEEAQRHGWWYEERNVFELLALVHSEVSEAVEDCRHGLMDTYFEPDGKPCGYPSELADIIIRVLDMAEAAGIDIDHEIRIKVDYNKTRPYRHGMKLA